MLYVYLYLYINIIYIILHIISRYVNNVYI